MNLKRSSSLLLFLALNVAGAFALLQLPVKAAEKDGADKDLEKLQGEWVMVSGLADGNAVPEGMLRTSSRVCKGNETIVRIGDQLIMRAKFTLDPTRTPKQIDYEVTEGPAKGGKMLGIYELEGNTVKFCFSASGAERPTKFESQLGEMRTFSVWQRKKAAGAAAPPAAPAPAPANPGKK